MKGFHITVEVKDVPGALSSVLELLRQHVDLTNTISYNTTEGRAISGSFAKALSPSVTESTLKRVISKSPFVEDYDVVGSRGGLVMDTFHTGIELGPDEPLVAMSVKGVSRMFNRLAKEFGTGGETILFEEGSALGQANGDYVKGLVGAKFVRKRARDLAALYRALGWGMASLSVRNRRRIVSVRVENCFECSRGRGRRDGCNFLRGHLVGIVSSFFGGKFHGEERKCRFRGDPFCEFYLVKG